MNPAQQVLSTARKEFASGKTKPIEWRKAQLRKLDQFLSDKEDLLKNSLHNDLRKAPFESVMTEIMLVRNEIVCMLRNLDSWSKPNYVSKSLAQTMDTIFTQRDPLGVVLVISAFNYPYSLLLLPVVGAIAAGNCVILKPSEIAGNVAKVLSEHLPQYLDPKCFPVYLGEIPETTLLLKERFDHIFFTGSSNVAKIVMAAAAKHLTPVTLELGGKSPVYVHEDSNLKLVAKRIMWGKCLCSGQTCLAPDYVLCHSTIQNQLINEMRKAITDMYGENPQESPDLPRLINERHYNRIRKILDSTQKEKIVVGGEMDEASNYIAPTVIRDVCMDDEVMKEEIFGPIMAIMPVSGVEEAVEKINELEKPLAIYIFSNSNSVVNKILQNTASGGVTVNDVVMHAVSHTLPFGGVGNSGMGNYHGKWSFNTFTHERAVSWRKQNMEMLVASRYPPYTEKKMLRINVLMNEKSACTVM